MLLSASFPSQATTFNIFDVMSLEVPPVKETFMVAFSMMNVQTLPQKRYVCSWPFILALIFDERSDLHILLSNSLRTFIAIVGDRIPFTTISSNASVKAIPRADLLYSSSCYRGITWSSNGTKIIKLTDMSALDYLIRFRLPGLLPSRTVKW